ncbi:uncharacterized protein Dyak_GE22649 [Drosophila yakuba]|uniref:Uncharacterized protein n=1 Tax=Drosophila yakuba TaxID=7245 RepID=B4PJ51_DROYA|nr:uncharacterized protein Dyak_GE22649 [Drosophila yakuba]
MYLFRSRERIKHGTLDHAPVTTGNKNNSINNNSISINSTNNNNNNNNSVSRNSSNNNSNGAVLDEYQYFAPSDPNNPNNQPQPDLKSSLSVTTTSLGLKLSQLPAALQQQAQHLQALQLQPDVTLTSLQKQPLATSLSITTPVPLAQTSPAQVLSSSRSCSSSPSIYIKDEPCSPLGGCPEERMTGNGLEATRKKLATIRPQTKQQLKARLQLPTPKNSSAYATSPPHLIINANNELIDTDAGDLEEDLDDFDEDDDVTGHCSPIVGQSDMMGADGRLSVGSIYIGEDGDCGRGLGRAHTQARHVPTSRELLYMKFGEFLAARLNTLHETVANELMNKMLLLIAEK